MRLPTIGFVVTAALDAARRFPLVIGASLVAAYAGVVLVNHPGDESPFTRLLVSATLGLPLLFALTVLDCRS